MFDIDKERSCWSSNIHNYYLEQYEIMFITSTAILKMRTIKKKDISKQQHGVCSLFSSDQSHCCCALSRSLSASVLHAGKEDWADALADQSLLYLLVYFFLALYIEHWYSSSFNTLPLGSFSCFFVVCFFTNKISSTIRVSNSLNLDQDGLSVLIWIQSNCQDYQQTTKVISLLLWSSEDLPS